MDCGARHLRRDALKAAVQARPGSSQSGNVDRKRDHRWRGPTQPEAMVRMGPNQPGHRATTRCRFLGGPGATFRNRKPVQPQLAGAHARLRVHALGIFNHAMGKHRPNRDSATPNSLLQALKLWYLMPALLHLPDGRTNRRQRFALVESGDTMHLLSWLIAYTRREGLRQRDAAQEASKDAKLERASAACRHVGGAKVEARKPFGRTKINGEQ